ncbi:glycosyltransferase family 2 protein [Rhodobacteraceae bacterium F11138]|nr:glycosyltransferase family 2 protein [Rhodobacteraceae bacterium F11138]
MTSQPAVSMPQLTAWELYRMRWKRRRLLWRSWRSRHQLRVLSDRSGKIATGDILAVSVMRNEIARLPFFLTHYRRLGVDHFLVVDNASDDGTAELLAEQPDVSVWQTDHSYRDARFGLDWLTWLQLRYAHGHWCLMVDADEMLIYADHDTRGLQDLTAWLQGQGRIAFGAMLLDLFPKGPLSGHVHTPGQDPTEVLDWFDPGPYRARRQRPMGNLWLQGGTRERVFLADSPHRAPTLNKLPLVCWNRKFAYVNSCHALLPPRLNAAYDGPGGDAPSGILLHSKFLPETVHRAAIEKERRQHFHDPRQFAAYYDQLSDDPDLWHPDARRLGDWRHLVELGLMSAGGW